MTTLQLPSTPFTTAHIDELGLTRRQLRNLVTEGRVRALLRDVFVDNAIPDSVALRAQGAALVVTADHVVTDRTAAFLHGVDIFTFSETEVLPRPDVCVERGARETKRTEVAAGSRWLDQHDVMVVDGVRVTTPLRTALDLGCRLHRRDAMAAMNALARAHGFGVPDLTAELPRYRRRRGVIQLRQLVPLVETRIESIRESWVWIALVDAGLPRPEPQLWIDIDGVPTYRLDFAYPRSRVVVEYDGADFHDSDEQKELDEARRDWLRRNGWTVIVVRNGDFTGRRLNSWIARVRQALADRPTNLRW